MDGHRFDALVRSLASGTSRRGVLKGILGIGAGAAAARGEVEAARRPTPTPKPVTCSSPKVLSGGQCVCPGGTSSCGPDCCPIGQAECCDNACCYGECFGEELCCPAARQFCAVSGECCAEGWRCCPGFGCIPPGGCCDIGECEARACHNMECGPNHTCDYTFNCSLDDDCCPDDPCYDGWCQENGACGEIIFDCRLDGGEICCGGRTCLPDGSCCLGEYCEITEECCGEFERCCPRFGCIPTEGCCDISECTQRDCFTVACDSELGCVPTRDCREGDNCCPDPGGCYRAVCLENGSCGEPEYDCTRGTDENPCCPPSTVCIPDGSCVERICDCREDDDCCADPPECFVAVCQEDGTCGEPEPDCRGWDEEVCCAPGTFCQPDGRCRCDCRRDSGCCPDRLCDAAICNEDGTCGGFEFNCMAGDRPEACCAANETCQDDGTCFCDCRRDIDCCPEDIGVCRDDGTCLCLCSGRCNQPDGCGGTCECGEGDYCDTTVNICRECPTTLNDREPCGSDDGSGLQCILRCDTEHALICFSMEQYDPPACITTDDCPSGTRCFEPNSGALNFCLPLCPATQPEEPGGL